MTTFDHRRFSPACARNRQPILDVLTPVFPERAHLLEIASGTGEHGAFFASRQPGWTWQPTDASDAAQQSTSAWVDHMGLPNLRSPVILDVTSTDWPIGDVQGMFCANMIHISPWNCTLGLLDGAPRLLRSGQHHVTYGPYKVNGHHTAPSNAAFDASLRSQDPSWGVRDLEVIEEEAQSRGLTLQERVQMPANNACLIFVRTPH